MVAALVGVEMRAAIKACAFCEIEVYDVRFRPVRGWLPWGSGGFCARCWRREVLPGDKCLLPGPEWAGDEQAKAVADWEARIEAAALAKADAS